MNNVFEKTAQILRESESILITAGAGMGVDSGLPDFRGNEGFWKAYPPIAKLGLSFSEMANPQWFSYKPKLAWGFYGHRLNLYRKTIPHIGFRLLLDYAISRKEKYFVFTSNVDGQFQKAGFDEELIVECHGSIHHFQCCKPCRNLIWDAKDIMVEVDDSILEATGDLPLCPNCGSLARPNVLMFGDWAWIDYRTNAQEERLSNWLNKINKKRLVIIELGAGRAVPTVRAMSESVFREFKCNFIRLNPRDYDGPSGTISINMNASAGLQRIFELI